MWIVELGVGRSDGCSVKVLTSSSEAAECRVLVDYEQEKRSEERGYGYRRALGSKPCGGWKEQQRVAGFRFLPRADIRMVGWHVTIRPS